VTVDMVQAADDTRRLQRAPGGSSRVPPHNLEAEQSLLGAMLLSRDAIVAAVEAQLAADDFYKPANGHVFDAITSLYAQGEPADPVTVADELRRANMLDAVGGAAVLISLQAGTPAIGNATRYARIVEEHALLRRLIAVAGHIAEMGYSVPEDVLATIDEAEALVFDVAQRRVTDSMLPIRELLERHLDHIEALYERGQDITGVPTGYLDLDQQLAGLQPANLVIVGGRPGTGKALALDTPIATPTGWTTMGDLSVGDEVFDERGRPCRVTFATPVMLGHRCYELTFDDGSTLVADADHQWFVYDHSLRHRDGRVVTTQDMLDAGPFTEDGRSRWHVPATLPLDLPERELADDPYLLGCDLGYGPSTGHLPAAYDVERPSLERSPSTLTRGHIPTVFLRASRAQRRDLLRGLRDTCGSTGGEGGAGRVLFLSSRLLAEQAQELVRSLGHTPTAIRELAVMPPGGQLVQAWHFEWAAVRSNRRVITAIRSWAPVPVRCITVDSPGHLYLAGRTMIPTHNTSFALGLAAHAALDATQPVLVFSLEMSHLELTQRLLCSEARVDASRMRNGKLLETDWPKISHAVGRLAEAPIHIDDNPRLTVMEIRAKARRLKSRSGLGLIVVDYLQLMTGRQSAENRQVEVSEISRGLKILARELEVPVVALSQLSRNLEQRADKRPVLADLRESGSLEQDADVVLFLYRDELYNRESPDRGTAEVIVAKHRNGPTGVTQLAFLENYTRFANMARM
jgi:replicative DNA helicase